MQPGINVWVVVYAIGAAQAALLALALWRRPANAAANRVLAAWLAAVAVDLVVKSIYFAAPSAPWFRAYRFVWLFPWLYGPAFYLYVRTLVSGHAPRMRDALHLAGFVAMAALLTETWFATPAELAQQYARWREGDWPPPLPWYDPILFVYALSYVGAAVWRVRDYRKALRDQRSDADRWSLRWVTGMALAQVTIWCIALLHVALKLPAIDYYLIYGAVAAWVCVAGYFSLSQPPMVEALAPEADAPAETGSATPPGSDDPRYPQVEARLQQLMAAQALYREPALTIGQLAKRSGYPEYLVSAVINRRFGASFCDWINGLRIEAARARLADPGDARTILDIAYDCGFTSKSTFNAAFKRIVGQTPSAYRSSGREAA